MKNESGAITLDFIFALVLVLSMTLLLGVFSFTLSVVEGVQYLTFSTSRAYYAGHINKAEQIKAGEKKFAELSKKDSFNKLLRKDWFNVTLDKIDNFDDIYSSGSDRDIVEGVRTKIVVGLLELQIPLFGSTKGDLPFESFITSFLGRESSAEECMSVVNERYREILKLEPYSSRTISPESYVSFDDNGC